MFHYFQYKRDEFLGHYHKRSNVESTFSMIKRKFSDSVRSRNDVRCKILSHNLCVLIQEQADLGIETEFWPEEMPKVEPPAQAVIDVQPLPVAEPYDFAELAFV